MTTEQTLRQAIAEVGRLLYERKLVVATDGNISARLDRKTILITPAGFCKGFLSPDDIIRLTLGSPEPPAPSTQHLAPSPGRPAPSTETAMHIAVYLARRDISAVIHAHPPYATGFAVSGRRLDASLLPETRIFDGPLGRVPYIEPGTSRLGKAVAQVIKNHNYSLLARHGAVAVGPDLLSALYRLERLEFLAQVTSLSRA